MTMPTPTAVRLSETQHDALTALAERPLTIAGKTILDRDRVHRSVAQALVDRGFATTLDEDGTTLRITDLGLQQPLGDGFRAMATRPPGSRLAALLAIEDGRILQLPVADVHPAADNVRQSVGDVTGLAASIVAAGILEPLLVTPLPDADGWRIVAGHRRHAAALAAGIATVPCIVRTLTDEQRVEAMTIENLQRAELTPLEEADAFGRLVELGWTQTKIAERVGIDQGTVSKRLSLRRLPEQARTMVADGSLPLDTAYAAAKLEPERLTAALHGKTLKGSRMSMFPGKGPLAARDLEYSIRAHAEEQRDERARTKARKQLLADGVPLVDPPDGMAIANVREWTHHPGFTALHRMGAGAPDVDTHARADCHAAIITGDGRIVYGCTDPDQHTQQTQAEHREPSAWELELAERERRGTAWDALETDRLAWLKTALARCPVDHDATAHTMQLLGGCSTYLDGQLFKDLTGGNEAKLREQARDGITGPGWAAWALAIATGEAATASAYLHRRDDPIYGWAARRHLAELARLAAVAATVDVPGGHTHHQQLAALLAELDDPAAAAA
jgi:ParB/RepB/Spo0J family partition protein